MLQTVDGEAPVKVEFENFEHGFPEGFGPGGWGRLAYAVGIAFAAFQLVVAAWNVLPSQVVRGVHVGFLLLMTFGLVANFTDLDQALRPASAAVAPSAACATAPEGEREPAGSRSGAERRPA